MRTASRRYRKDGKGDAAITTTTATITATATADAATITSIGALGAEMVKQIITSVGALGAEIQANTVYEFVTSFN